ncbi:IgGFc-binding protein-like [Rhinatrema bivittatum]|uniref:IgGFc-binding protein-like n=1 Tax=Rhinatrema bivittatum TaxID=194408 RepID=UPI00112DAF81|nr:IgGFc-binding protein-like [Rhinatrema bivittatum]
MGRPLLFTLWVCLALVCETWTTKTKFRTEEFSRKWTYGGGQPNIPTGSISKTWIHNISPGGSVPGIQQPPPGMDMETWIRKFSPTGGVSGSWQFGGTSKTSTGKMSGTKSMVFQKPPPGVDMETWLRKFFPTGRVKGWWQWGNFHGKTPTTQVPESLVHKFFYFLPFGRLTGSTFRINVKIPAGENVEQWLYKHFQLKKATGEQSTLNPSTIFFLLPPDQVVTEWWLYKNASDLPSQFVTDGPLGMEFITAYMSNSNQKVPGDLRLLITGFQPATRCTIILNKSKFKMEVLVEKRETISIPIPQEAELAGSDMFSSSVKVQCDKPITLVSVNSKGPSADSAIVYPLHFLGNEYYISTPSGEASGNMKEIAVITYNYDNQCDLYITGAVTLQNRKYPAGSKLTLPFKSLEVAQIQSSDNLSGSRVVCQRPAVVLSGHNCYGQRRGCAHKYTQLQPVSIWGTSYIVPNYSFQTKNDVVEVIASKNCKLHYKYGPSEGTKDLVAGQVIPFQLVHRDALCLSADVGIQVVLYSAGGLVEGKEIDSFQMNIHDTATFCTSYIIYGQKSIERNYALILVKNSATSGILFDGQSINNIQWKPIAGTDYSFGEFKYGGGSSFHIVQHATVPFGLTSMGFSDKASYAFPVLCTGLTEIHIKLLPWTTSEEGKLPEPPKPKPKEIPVTSIESFPEPPSGVNTETWMYNIFHGKPEEKSTPWILRLFSISKETLMKPGAHIQFPTSMEIASWIIKNSHIPAEMLPKPRPSTTMFLLPPMAMVTENWIYRQALPDLPAQFLTDGPMGLEFLTTFMANQDPKVPGDFKIWIQCFHSPTSVTIWVNKSDFKKKVTMNKWETVSISIPQAAELHGTDISKKSVIVQSDKPITVNSVNSKYRSVEKAIIYPVQYSGKEYYVFTPNVEKTPFKSEFAIITNCPNTVDIYLTATVTHRNRSYPKGSKMTVSLETYDVLQMQSSGDLSGTIIRSQKPVILTCGHSCFSKNSGCDLVFKQVQPASSWGTDYIVPARPFQQLSDIVSIVASKNTQVNYKVGDKQGTKNLVPGEVWQMELKGSETLAANASHGIQLFFLYTGGVVEGKEIDPFLVDIPDTASYCNSYIMYEQESNDLCYAVIIAKSSATSEILLDGQTLSNIQWIRVAGKDYSIGQLKFGRGYCFHTVQHPTVPFGFLTASFSKRSGSGSRGHCTGFNELHLKLLPWSVSEMLKLPEPPKPKPTEIPVPEPSKPKPKEIPVTSIESFPEPPSGVNTETWMYNIFHGKPEEKSTPWILRLFSISKETLMKPGAHIQFPTSMEIASWIIKNSHIPAEMLPKPRPSTTMFLLPPMAMVTENWIYRQALPDLPAQFLTDGPMGLEFLTTFMANQDPKVPGDFKIWIQCFHSPTSVTIWVNKSDFKKKVTMNKWETVAISIPQAAELHGTDISKKSIIVQSDKPITANSVNSKYRSVEKAIIYPVQYSGKEYYISTPSVEKTSFKSEFAIITNCPNIVDIYLTAPVTHRNRSYPKGSKMTVSLETYDVLQMQSSGDLSGTRILCQKPVTVMCGHSCFSKNSGCDLVIKQAQPASSWGTDYIVPPRPFQQLSDIVSIVASKNTQVNYEVGDKQGTKNLVPGEVWQMELKGPETLAVHASHGIQLFFLSTGGVVEGEEIDPFLVDITDTASYCNSYIMYEQESNDLNYAVIIVNSSATSKILFDGQTLSNIQWTRVARTDYSFGQLKFVRGYGFHTLQHPTVPFALLTASFSERSGSGSRGLCTGFNELHLKLLPWSVSEMLKLPEPPKPKQTEIPDPCKVLKCREHETCQNKNGKAQCIPNFTGTCWGWGDPHYKSFDGYKFDLQGTCTYTLAKYAGNDPTLVPFNIDEKNENRGNQAVSYVRQININIHGIKVSMVKGETGKIRINDVITNLPVTLEQGKIKVTVNGRTALLEANNGLRVSYNWKDHCIIIIPSSYYGTMVGLCGNFNENPKDDRITSGGTQASSIVEWAKSWRVNDRDLFCWDDCPGRNCPTCKDNQKVKYEGENYCGLINQRENGPFRECYGKISPDNFFDSCVFDVCMNQGAKQFLCQALDAYATSCRDEGVKIYDWRTPSGCPLPCHKNSHYEFCGNACTATCSDRTAPDRCAEPCQEICQCNDGFVFSIDKCVPVGNCGCTYNDIYYKPGEIFWADENCHVYCNCDPSSGKVVCKNSACKDVERCLVLNGIRGCHSLNYSTCSISGDLHYTTFDGKRYDFMGDCIYQLVGMASKDSTLTPFTIQVQNSHHWNRAASLIYLVIFEAYGITITMSRDYPQRIQVNGIFMVLPFYFQTNKIVAFSTSTGVRCHTDFDVTVAFDSNGHLTVRVPVTYAGAIIGLCGNNNKNANDDMKMKNGKEAPDKAQFGDSWKVAEVPGCLSSCTENCLQCTDAQKEVYKGELYCGLIIKKDGPFKLCHAIIDPMSFFIDCVSDTCEYKGHYFTLGYMISLYATACQAQDIQIEDWRVILSLRYSCPKNSHYELCGPGCPATCRGLSSPMNCDLPCTEGCFCDNGFLLSGDTCVPIADCGCVHQGTYYKKGDIFYPDESCREQCRCGDNGINECQQVSCGKSEECKVANGLKGCHSKKCGSCIVSSGSHYRSFDGFAFNFHGTCTYVVAKAVVDNPRLPTFSVVLENERQPNGKAENTKRVEVFVYGHTIRIERGMQWNIKINNQIFNLPVSIYNNKIWVSQEGYNIILQTHFNLKILYNRDYILVQVPSAYQGSLQGLCGNFNDNKNDEFMLPSNQLTENIDEFGANWKVPTSGSLCKDGCEAKCPVFDLVQLGVYAGNDKCGIISSDKGPFKDCHGRISPVEYMRNCMYDMGALNGAIEVLCKSLQAYSTACQAVGAKITAWRQSNFCPVSCPPNSHYKLCINTCDFTCAGIIRHQKCTNKCFEGCQCNTGYLFSGEECVTMDKCGCLYNGMYIKVGEAFVLEDCSRKCICQPRSGLQCEALTCGEGESCMLKNGLRGCFTMEGQCTITPDGQFSTFDGVSGLMLSDEYYEIASHCNADSADWFRVVVSVTPKKKDRVPGTAVYIMFHNAFVAINRQNAVWVQGRQVKSSATIAEGITVTIAGDAVIITRALKMQLHVNSNGGIILQVNQVFANALCGPCGNFNGVRVDDLLTPDGQRADTISQVIYRWKPGDFFCC